MGEWGCIEEIDRFHPQGGAPIRAHCPRPRERSVHVADTTSAECVGSEATARVGWCDEAKRGTGQQRLRGVRVPYGTASNAGIEQVGAITIATGDVARPRPVRPRAHRDCKPRLRQKYTCHLPALDNPP